ncbi:MAG: WbqC family protein [Candidatus Melainabacteria bacterium]|nr:WbqC family protein [Candidatus Melainabacteria bacterium]
MKSDKKIAILQSNYIPWKGYFDLLNKVDEFIYYDHVQYTKNDWRNRNKIKTNKGIQWLTIPVRIESLSQAIMDTLVASSNWSRKHWTAISNNYSKAKYFSDYKERFESLYLRLDTQYLCEINYEFIKVICEILDIKTKFNWSTKFKLSEGKTERLVDICKQAKATCYITGPSAINYIDKNLFEQEGIKVEFMDYSNYPEYKQLYPPFVHEVSILDLIFNAGPHATRFMKSFSLAGKK